MAPKAFSFLLRNMAGTITGVSTLDRVAALTFDDGPDPRSTPKLLELLKSHRVAATFFVLGKAAHQNQALLKQMADDGHAICNHSWDHQSFPLISGRERRKQIRDCANAIAPYGKRLFRPPYGHQNLASRFDAFVLGHKIITWTLMAEDWLDHDASVMADRLINGLCPGSIILLHDTLNTFFEDKYCDREPMLEALDMLLDQAQGQFQFVTVPELLKHGRVKKQNWYRAENRSWLDQLKGSAS
jgi:peptidoglycan/xylan/chitin deacetylase (PgdA/CDA1 family)